MSNPTIESKLNNTDRINLIFENALAELNLIITTQINKKIKSFTHNLIYLKITIEKINSDSRSEIIKKRETKQEKHWKNLKQNKKNT